jgi:hypothetical protein
MAEKKATKKVEAKKAPVFSGPEIPSTSITPGRVSSKCPFCHAMHFSNSLGVVKCDVDAREYLVFKHGE